MSRTGADPEDDSLGSFICCNGWRRSICAVDLLQHRILRRVDDARSIGIICDLHDWAIGMTWKEARSRG